MDHLLNLSTAAKLVGVSRGTIQSKIEKGELETFEGHVRMSSLCKVYPEAENQTDQVLERVNRIRDSAVWEANHTGVSGERLLTSQAHQLQVDLKEVKAELDTYKMLIDDLQDRLAALAEDSDRMQKQKITALLHWLSSKL